MKPEEGVLVQRGWAERVNNALFGGKPATSKTNKSKSLFYSIIPVVLFSNWENEGERLYKASAKKIGEDGNESNSSILVYWNGNIPYGGRGTKFYAVWRGRWETLPKQGRLNVSVSDNILYIRID